MLTVGRLAKKFGLSRSTLLYYDSVGLLQPSSRTGKGYRVYADKEINRLEQICRYRRAGLALEDIKEVLDSPESKLSAVLEKRLNELNDDIGRLQEQQRFIVELMEKRGLLVGVRVMSRDSWMSLLAAAGFSSEDMQRWHAQFESSAPDKHLEFLELLGCSEDEVRTIRSWATLADATSAAKKPTFPASRC